MFQHDWKKIPSCKRRFFLQTVGVAAPTNSGHGQTSRKHFLAPTNTAATTSFQCAGAIFGQKVWKVVLPDHSPPPPPSPAVCHRQQQRDSEAVFLSLAGMWRELWEDTGQTDAEAPSDEEEETYSCHSRGCSSVNSCLSLCWKLLVALLRRRCTEG